MDITEVRVTLREEPRLKAFVNVTFDDDFVVRGMKVIDGRNGLFVAMPSRRSKDGTFRDIAHPINNDMRKRLEDIVLEEYHKKCKESGKTLVSSSLEQEDFEVPEDAIDADVVVMKDEEDATKDEEDVMKDEEDAMKDEEDAMKDEEDVMKDEEDVMKDEEDVMKDEEDVMKDEEDVMKDEEEKGEEEESLI